ncbi:MAG: phosphate/phosphite/phosphonate ABC transporter substrate-binding protein [Candidatus Omnitrophica bacterium]|nr:phosphate/phosphite/phosphonate ABC transporter substrate-binding protein [Candidatus Omnitrophota bacterium]MBU4478184.1 phosphate/phosphite/phosphonate ABC transporter substrate-binding protein [Candidatus Omnitrophota bacterium]MCG2703820.1 phosphate/phosphite/phosphonate ABC transporter substrate-binding protein [Candidatus Omnitrophota bacterium]
MDMKIPKTLLGIMCIGLLLLNMIVCCPAEVKAEEEITFAMLPQMANAIAFKKWKPILDHLEKQTKYKFTQVFPKDFDEHVKLCQEGKIDFAYSNPITYIQMAPKAGERKDGHIAIALANRPQGARDFYGLFIIRADNPNIKTINDIKGKKGWIVGWTSAGGYTFQQAYALDNGIDLKTDCMITEAPENKQEKVIMAVYNRETDFGCIRNGMLNVMKDKIDLSQLKIFAETPRYPAWVLSYNSRLKPKVVSEIEQALLKVPEGLLKEVELPGKPTGFVKAIDSDLDSIRKVADKVNIAY